MYDVIVIGASITGGAIARDLARRGLHALVIDSDDIGNGTTHRSTRLIHGGLRYLEHLELRLVRDSLRERDTLFRIAPHLVRPLEFLLPFYDGGRAPWFVRTGLFAYDWFARDGGAAQHRALSLDDTLRFSPGLRAQGLRSSCVYTDGQAPLAERLALEYVIDAARHGADVRTHSPVESLIMTNNSVAGVLARDKKAGDGFEAKARVVVNATGPWADGVTDACGLPSRLRGTKGTHIVVPAWDGAPGHAVYLETIDRRPVFILPFQRNVLVGTTDTDFQGEPRNAYPTTLEARYLLAALHKAFPDAKYATGDIIHAYSGVRPLVACDARHNGAVARGHVIRDHARDGVPGLVSVYGGKLTVARQIGEEVGDMVAEKLGVTARSTTAEAALPGAEGLDTYAPDGGCIPLDARRFAYLTSVYGSRAGGVVAIAKARPTLADRIVPHRNDVLAQVVFAVREEYAKTLSDVLLRRTGVGSDVGQGLDCAELVARVMAPELGWSEDHIRAEVANYAREIKTKYTVR